jgi:hypothetical protein
MTRWILALTLSLTLMVGVTAQDVPEEAPRVFPEEVVRAKRGFRMPSRVLFVVDVSGSMKGEPLRQAVSSVLLIAGSDQFRVAAIAFTGSHTRWPGVPRCHPGQHEPQRRPGVQAMPAPAPQLVRKTPAPS